VASKSKSSAKGAFDRVPEAFCKRFEKDSLYGGKDLHARRYASIGFSETRQIDCRDLRSSCSGHRADIVIMHAARALAAFEGRHEATSG
jgi:Mg-chelatase subunit ChlI